MGDFIRGAWIVPVVGPQGPQGPQGPSGQIRSSDQVAYEDDICSPAEIDLQGPQGPQGEIGPQGLRGEMGPQGPQGEVGSQGLPGHRGLRGETGLDGSQGLRGDTGLSGPQGPRGDAGPQGPRGDIGPQGPIGIPGTSSGMDSWRGRLHAAWGNGNPRRAIAALHCSPSTVTNMNPSIGRLVQFRFPSPISVARIRYYGTGNSKNQFTMAIYDATTGEMLWLLDPANTSTDSWSDVDVSLDMAADKYYWFGFGTKKSGAVTAFQTPHGIVARSLGDSKLPDSIARECGRFGQVSLKDGSWPKELPKISDAAFAGGNAGTLPIVLLESAQ